MNNLKNTLNNNNRDSSVFSRENIQSLAYKTPFFLFDKNKIISNYLEFKQHFPQSLIYYAMKANSEPEVLQKLSVEGCGFEVASIYELNILKKLKVVPEKIVYGTAIKPAGHVREFYNYGVDTFVFDSLQEVEKIAREAPKSKVFVRTIANDAGSVFKFSEKFGADVKDIIPLLLRAKDLGLHPYGISFHVGSQASDPRAWADTLERLAPILQDLREKGVMLDVINIGGGYPCQYASSEEAPMLDQIAEYTLEKYKELPYQPTIMTEPGRGIIADAGVLVSTVIARVERKEFTWLFLDAGCYNALFETMAYQGSTRYAVESMRAAGSAGEKQFALAGPTGDSEDVISREALLPANIDIGDKLIFYHVGAYSLTASSNFNGFPRPTVYYT